MRKPPNIVIHINFLPDVLLFEPRRIWTALNTAAANGKISSTEAQDLSLRLGETAIFLGQRDYILRTSVRVLRNSLASLTEKIPDLSKIPELDRDGFRYRVLNGQELFKDRDIVLLAVDSLLFELRAYLDLLATFVYEILRGIGKAPQKQETLASGELVTILDGKSKLRPNAFLKFLCDRLSVETSWYEFLSRHRNFFTHEGAPYIAIEPIAIIPQGLEFIIMRKNIHNFSQADPGDYFRLSEFTEVLEKLRKLTGETQRYLVDKLER